MIDRGKESPVSRVRTSEVGYSGLQRDLRLSDAADVANPDIKFGCWLLIRLARVHRADIVGDTS